jgi:predicted DNA binding protein
LDKGLKLAKVRLFHQDCFASRSVEKFPEITLFQKSNQVIHERGADGVVYTVVWDIRAPRKKDLEDYLEYLRRYPGVLKVQVLSEAGKTATVLIRVRSASASYDTILKQGVHYLSPVKVIDGLEEHKVLLVDAGKLKNVLEEFDGLGEVKLASVGKLEPNDEFLTPKQQDALEKALRHGYYDWPKKVSLDDLAEIAGVHRRTFHERLRRAEAKLIPKLLSDYELF